MRTISGQTLSLLANKQAIEPVFILETQFGTFADRTIPGAYPGKIISVSGFDSTTRLDGGGQSSQVSIVVDDIDGSCKRAFDNHDIHKTPAYLYQWFQDMPLGEKFLILSGVISSPIVWDEGQRTFAFDIVSRLESREVGFSAEEGVFNFIPYPLLGTPWPFIFGKVVHAPGMQLQEIPTAFTKTHMAFPDESLMQEFHRQNQHAMILRYQSNLALQNATNYCFSLSSGVSDENCNEDSTFQGYVQESIQLLGQALEADNKASEAVQLYQQQSQFPSRAELVPSKYVTQKYTGKLRVGSNIFTGEIDKNSGFVKGPPLIKKNVPQISTEEGITTVTPPPERTGFNFIQAGTTVAIADDYPIQYLISAIPGTVEKVWAYRSTNGLRTLALVPDDWYTVTSLGYGSTGPAVIIELKMPLSIRAWREQENIKTWENNYGAGLPLHVVNSVDWEDDIYVTFNSSVGPSPKDIMQWVIDNYCPGLTTDSSFNTALEQAKDYSMNFIYSQRSDAVQFLKDIAYQCNCALWIDTDKIYARYLPAQPSPVDTITMNDIVEGSLQVTSTTTEELITKYSATFRPDYLPNFSDPVKLILRNNIGIYGVQEESFDYFAYSALAPVQKAATFWMIRKSNTWKLLRCKLFISKLNIETMDAVTLNFTPTGWSNPWNPDGNFVANQPVLAIVNSANYNSEDNTIDVEFWVTVKLGNMTTYPASFPGSTHVSFPTNQDVSPGGGGDIGGGAFKPANTTQVAITGGGNYGGAGDAIDDPEESSGTGNPITYGDFYVDMPDVNVRDPGTYTIFPEPTYDYQYDPFDTKDPLPPPPSLIVAPGRVVKKGEGQGETQGSGTVVYDVMTYMHGLGEDPVKIPVKQLQIDMADEIPEGTMVVVVIRVIEGNREAFMQVPVWLA